MIFRILLFFLYTVLVSTNTGPPAISAQTYPIYQQNSYANPSANQPSDFAPYLQNMMAQNQSPQLNLSPSNIRQMLLNRILSDPSMQTIMDSNLNGYGSNLAGFPNNPIAPNPVSNYFGVPTEYSNNDLETEDKSNKSTKKRSSKAKRKKKNKNDSNTQNVENTEKKYKKSRKRSRKQNTEMSLRDSKTKNNENEGHIKTKTRKRKNKESEQTKISIDKESKAENPKPRRRHKKKRKSDKENADNPGQKTVSNIELKEIKDGINLDYFNEGIIEENRVARNPIHAGNDILKLIPNMPENIGNNFMQGLPQFENNPLISNFLTNYENMYQSLLNRMETNGNKENKRKKPKRRKQNRKRNGQNNRNSTEDATVLVKPSIIAVNPKIDIVTTERTIIINEKTRANVDSVTKDKSSKSFNNPPDMKEDTLKVGNEELLDKFNENITQDSDLKNGNDPNNDHAYLGYGYIDDYYPLFTDSAAYTANNKEVYIKNLGDIKYYYTTDKVNVDPISQRTIEEYRLPEQVMKDYEINKEFDDIEKEGIKKAFIIDVQDKIKEVQFRSPPHLELPDFITRKVERSEISPEPHYNDDENFNSNHQFGRHKSSSYSEAKTPYYSGVKHSGIKSHKEKPHKDIETVFAKSKVVKYGPVYIPEEEEGNFSPNTNNQAITDETYFKDGGTTYVLAKSLDYPESFW